MDVSKFFYYYILAPIVITTLPIFIRNYIYSYINRKKLQGQVVLVTGASSGLGEAIAKELYNKGCKLILAARRLDQLERVKNEITGISKSGMVTHAPAVLKMDLADLESLPKVAAEALKIYGRIDVLINNAGVSFRGRIEQTDLDVHQRIMTVNYFGQICLTKALLPSMIAQKSGSIVMINSIQGKLALPQRSAYSASKHALQAYSDSLRAEVAKKGVQVTVINPGYVNTAISLNALTADGSTHAKMDENTAKGYTADECAVMIVKAIVNEEKELVIAPPLHKAAIICRTLFPSIIFYAMQRRDASNK